MLKNKYQENDGCLWYKTLPAALIALSIMMAGYFIGCFYFKAHIQDRFVVVKGLAEKEVSADLAIWPIIIQSTGNDLLSLNTKIEADRATLIEFLLKRGFKSDEIVVDKYIVNDLLAQRYRDPTAKDSRYIITATVTLKTKNIELVQSVGSLVSSLVQHGITFDESNPIYEFTKFNDIKPEMLADAVKNARASAEEFTKNSGTKIGKLRKANQGVFLVSPADSGDFSDEYANAKAAAQSVRKKIRVVTTLEYTLE